jgi:hypothetical protein
VTRSAFRTVVVLGVAAAGLAGVLAYRWWFGPPVGVVFDEAMSATPRREAASFPAADELLPRAWTAPDAAGGARARSRRNTWIVWSAATTSCGTPRRQQRGRPRLLKVLSSHPSQKYSRACDPARLADGSCQNRWEYFGLVNEPCFERASAPDPARMGLWVDRRKAGCAPDPFENADKYPGVRIGARGTTVNGRPFDTGSYYGYATGIVGFRLFPNRTSTRRRPGAGTRAVLHGPEHTTTARS